MPISISQAEQLQELAKRRTAAAERKRRANAEFDQTTHEILAVLNQAKVKKVTVADTVFDIRSVVNWRSFDDDGSATERYPIKDYPELYSLDYQKTKAALNRKAGLLPNDTKLVGQFLGFDVRLFVTKLKNQMQRRPYRGR